MIQAIIEERNERGEFKHLKDFIERMGGREVNKRTIEKTLSRRAYLTAWAAPGLIHDDLHSDHGSGQSGERKYSMTGQMSLFDGGMMSRRKNSRFRFRKWEYEKENKLAFEKEVLGVYLTDIR